MKPSLGYICHYTNWVLKYNYKFAVVEERACENKSTRGPPAMWCSPEAWHWFGKGVELRGLSIAREKPWNLWLGRELAQVLRKKKRDQTSNSLCNWVAKYSWSFAVLSLLLASSVLSCFHFWFLWRDSGMSPFGRLSSCWYFCAEAQSETESTTVSAGPLWMASFTKMRR